MANRPDLFGRVHKKVKRGLKLAGPRNSDAYQELIEINATLTQMVDAQRENINGLKGLLKEHERVDRHQEEVIDSQDQVIANLEEWETECLNANHNLRLRISNLEKSNREVTSRLHAAEDENLFLQIKLEKLESLSKGPRSDHSSE